MNNATGDELIEDLTTSFKNVMDHLKWNKNDPTEMRAIESALINMKIDVQDHVDSMRLDQCKEKIEKLFYCFNLAGFKLLDQKIGQDAPLRDRVENELANICILWDGITGKNTNWENIKLDGINSSILWIEKMSGAIESWLEGKLQVEKEGPDMAKASLLPAFPLEEKTYNNNYVHNVIIYTVGSQVYFHSDYYGAPDDFDGVYDNVMSFIPLKEQRTYRSVTVSTYNSLLSTISKKSPE